MYNYQFNSMSTTVKVSINHELFANDLMPIYKLFELIDSTCSRFRVDSELSRMNQHVEKNVPISSEMFAILSEADRFYRETDGIFNPSVLTALENSGYTQSIETIKGLEIAAPARFSAVSINTLPFTLNERIQAVTLYAIIDLGGIVLYIFVTTVFLLAQTFKAPCLLSLILYRSLLWD